MSTPAESPLTYWPFLVLLTLTVAGISMFARYNTQFCILTLMILFATVPSFKDKPKTANIEYVQTPFFTVGITLPLRCINDSALGRQCQPDNVVFGAFNRWGTLSLLTLSEDAGRLVHTASTYTKSATDAFKVHVIAPLTHLLTPEEPKKADTKKAKKEL